MTTNQTYWLKCIILVFERKQNCITTSIISGFFYLKTNTILQELDNPFTNGYEVDLYLNVLESMRAIQDLFPFFQRMVQEKHQTIVASFQGDVHPKVH